VGREDLLEDPDFKSGSFSGPFVFKVIRPALEEWTRNIPKYELAQRLVELGFSAAPVQDARELVECSHLKARGMIVEMGNSVGGRIKVQANPLKLSRTPPFPLEAPPRMGEHNREVFCGLLGLPQEELERLKGEGII
jgi:crotonobetainyl-CoA:carnitine CoA-transferase CaiB-like acyl-CoA transferase